MNNTKPETESDFAHIIYVLSLSAVAMIILTLIHMAKGESLYSIIFLATASMLAYALFFVFSLKASLLPSEETSQSSEADSDLDPCV